MVVWLPSSIAGSSGSIAGSIAGSSGSIAGSIAGSSGRIYLFILRCYRSLFVSFEL